MSGNLFRTEDEDRRVQTSGRTSSARPIFSSLYELIEELCIVVRRFNKVSGGANKEWGGRVNFFWVIRPSEK